MDTVMEMHDRSVRAKNAQEKTGERRWPPLPLSAMQPGEKALVTGVHGSDAVKKHLEDLGFVPGSVIEVLSGQTDGSRIVSLKQSRLALTAGLAAKVQVKRL